MKLFFNCQPFFKISKIGLALFSSMLLCLGSVQAQDNLEMRVPRAISHLNASNKLIIRTTHAPKHNVFQKVLCFKHGCRRAAAWKRAQKARRFDEYQDVPQLRKSKHKPAPEDPIIHITEPPVPKPDTADIKKKVAPPKPVERKFVLSDVLFDVNSPTIKKEVTKQLDTLVNLLRKNERLLVHIVGHTDNTGREAYNQRLSTSRAEAVGLYLMDNGIAIGRITFEGKGSSEPIADNTFDEGRRKNRRVEIILKE
ncbi:MAG: OmpA family protein [Cyclobacteriaceae bacterium]|nr:OmpA family protein [Cyclobacteriaceae bacterium]